MRKIVKALLSVMLCVTSLFSAATFDSIAVNAENNSEMSPVQQTSIHIGTEESYSFDNTIYFKRPSLEEEQSIVFDYYNQVYGNSVKSIIVEPYIVQSVADASTQSSKSSLIETRYKTTSNIPPQPWVSSSTTGHILYRASGGGTYSISVSFNALSSVSCSINVPIGEVGSSNFDYSFEFSPNRECKLKISRTYECKLWKVTIINWDTSETVNYTTTSSQTSLRGDIVYK